MLELLQVTGTAPITALATVVVLLLISAFFSSSEIALFSIDDLFVAGLNDGDGRASALRRLREDPHRLLVTILVGNNVVNIAIASIATTLLVDRLPAGYAVTASTVVVSVLVLVVGEISPKSYGVANAESWALRVARPLEIVQTVMYPLVAGFDLLTRGIVRVTGGSTTYQPPSVTRAEVHALVESAERAGVVHPSERELLRRVLDFSGRAARDVMTPRRRIVAVDADATVERAVRICAEYRVTHLPVYEGSLDRIVGSVDLRDLVAALDIGASDVDASDVDDSDVSSIDSRASNESNDSPTSDTDAAADVNVGAALQSGVGDASVSARLHPVLTVFGDRAIDGVLRELQDERYALAVVLDASGTVEGILTAEDIVEELVGELPEGDDPSPITRVAEHAVIARGDASLSETVRLVGVPLPDGDNGSTDVASFVAAQLGRPPVSGDVVRADGLRLTVGAVENDRAARVRVEAGSGDTDPR
jgi:CBS domain containing-hemolysin-like protein